ncbi:MAG: VENN motif pre-toxin domain-containing protein, partial [Pantoea sp.]|nr:VENN motif pre-toxin domain-containing protein [Pantoea sp.]
MADIARTQGQIEATKAGKAELAAKGVKEPGENATKKEIAAYNKALTETSGYKTAQQKWGTGNAIQQGIQAATAAVQGLAGGNLGQALSGAAAPYLAEQIHRLTEGNPEAQAMAHAVVGAVVAQASGNSALAGAAGAVSGEVMAQLMMEQLYPGKEVSSLTETEKQTLSALGTLAAGLAGGVVGDSTADAVAGAQIGKNAAENNALGAMAGSGLGFWLGKTPGATAEDKAKMASDIAKGNAIVSAELAGTVGLGVLPKGAQVTAVIGGGANTIIQYIVNGEVNYTDALIASWVGAATSNTGLSGTVGWNAAGGATSNYIKGDDPLSGAIISGGSAG